MVNEVNKIVYNTLLSQGGVYLPDVGTIYVTRIPAAKTSRNSISAPSLTLELSPNMLSASIINAIVNTAQVDTTLAEDIYRRWLEKVSNDGNISIYEVCSIHKQHIVIDPRFSDKLNPNLNKEMTISRHSHTGRNVSIILTLLSVALGAAYYLYNNILGHTTSEDIHIEMLSAVVEDNNLDETEDITTENQDIISDCIIDTTAENEEIIEEQGSTCDIVESTPADDWRQRDDIRHWVVVGSYSTEENVARAIANLEAHNPDIKFDIFELGSMYAIAAFGSSEYADCKLFKDEHIKQFAQAWIHTPRKYKE